MNQINLPLQPTPLCPNPQPSPHHYHHTLKSTLSDPNNTVTLQNHNCITYYHITNPYIQPSVLSVNMLTLSILHVTHHLKVLPPVVWA